MKKIISVTKANEVLVQNKITVPPVDVVKIANKAGIEVFYKALPDDISGLLYVEDDTTPAKIVVNDNHNEHRQRFTIAHELGHYFLHKSIGMHIDKHTFFRENSSSSDPLYSIEIESNRFAAELLMPKDMVIRVIEKFKKDQKVKDFIDTDEDLIKFLADKFNVSLTAMSIKFQSLGFSF